jgi:hypothetical protein
MSSQLTVDSVGLPTAINYQLATINSQLSIVHSFPKLFRIFAENF